MSAATTDEDVGEVGDKLEAEEYAELLRRVSKGSKSTLAKLPPYVPPLVHLRAGPRSACAKWRRVRHNVIEYEEDYTRELSTDLSAVTCPECVTQERASRPTLWARFKTWFAKVLA